MQDQRGASRHFFLAIGLELVEIVVPEGVFDAAIQKVSRPFFFKFGQDQGVSRPFFLAIELELIEIVFPVNLFLRIRVILRCFREVLHVP